MSDADRRGDEDEAAVQFAHTMTKLHEATIRAVLRSRDRYSLGLGIKPQELAHEGETPEGIRAEQPDLFPADSMTERVVNTTLELEYIMRDSDVAEPLIRTVLAADREYARRRGVVD
jgi:hypothetical protein